MCFGEILWDRLPHGDFLGGAPFNVACHLARLGVKPVFVSAVGRDPLGDKALARAAELGVPTGFVQRLDDLPTGTVQASLDADRNASYEIAEPVAWDAIPCKDEVIKAAKSCNALVFGSLAMRSPENRRSLETLRKCCGGIVVMDVNLRAPHDDPDLVLKLARGADILKLNQDEVFRLAGLDADSHTVEDAARSLSKLTKRFAVCVTLGPKGALFIDSDGVAKAQAPRVKVADTVGAGDAFMASFVTSLVNGRATSRNSEWLHSACRLGALVASKMGATPDYDPTEASSPSSPPAHPKP